MADLFTDHGRHPSSAEPVSSHARAATTRTDVGPGEEARAGLANNGTWSGSSDTQLRRPACSALTSGGTLIFENKDPFRLVGGANNEG